ncbi:sulfotransferase domain-containing protein [Altericroceibacterium endophyticum]|uniref:Sulfotransferase domain-containing protein n=1 Tax=Altericroceibacterium endophyticum TaxID=1808508 RepID=A0A6I4T9V3_9SPHN|nr:sulfotransferase domain-containing protein [Altericroceibacterium endophyticum]MXO67072.1 hypothetical protein [Altericroceibacterium endophyticum]
MHLLQNGLPKSGNYWLFNILTLLLNAARLPDRNFIAEHPIQAAAKNWTLSYPEQPRLNVLDIEPGHNFYRIGSYFREPIEDLQDYIAQNRLVWTHSRHIPESERVYDAFDKIVYIIRDPRDVAISMANFAFTPYRQKTEHFPFSDASEYLQAYYVKHLSGWTQHVGSHLLALPRKNMHILFYERLKEDFDSELSQLINFLGLNVSSKQRAEIADQVTVASMKKKSSGHVRSGSAGGWRNVLSSGQIRLARLIAGELMDELDYPLRVKDASLPTLPRELSRKRIKRSMRKGVIARGVNMARLSAGYLTKIDKPKKATQDQRVEVSHS